MLEAVWHDVRLALRSIRRAPAFSLIVISTIALAIGANTALFSLVNGLVLKSLPVREPATLVALTPVNERGTGAQFIYESTLRHVRAIQRAFDGMAMYSGGGYNRVEARGAAADGGMEGLDPEYFAMVGAKAALGRLLTADDSIGPEGAAVVVLSDRLWRRLFGGDPRAIGEAVNVDGKSFTVVGVLPPGFHGLQADGGTDLFMTIKTLRARAGDMTRPLRARNVIARLRPGVTIEQARAQMMAQWPSARAVDIPGLPAVDRDTMRSQTVAVDPIGAGFSPLRDRFADPLIVLVGLTALLLAIGCANLSGLLLARAAARYQQIAVRRALGASRARLVQHLIVETLLLSILGTTAAIPLAWWTSRVIGMALTAGNALPVTMKWTPDARVLAASALVALATGLIVGLLPAWRATRIDVTLKGSAATVNGWATLDAGRVLTGSTTTGRTLLVAQIALSLVLLVIASLFAQSIMRLHANAPGSRPSQLVWARLWTLPGDRTPTFGAPYWTALAQRFAEIRDVQSVAYSFNFPAMLGATPAEERFSIADSGAGEVTGSSDAISPGFFQTTGIGLLQGRDISWADTTQTPMVGIVSQSLARILFRDEPVVGRQVRLRRDPSRRIEIIGVAADAAVGNMHDPRPLVLYRPLLQEPSRARIPNALLRSRGDVDAVRQAYPRMASAGGHHFTRTVYRLDESANQAVLRERLVAWFASFFATLAVVLSCIGVYGLLAYSVARRTREIGVRMALGAAPGVLVAAIAREGALLGLAGVALGIPVALGAGRFAASLLYGLTPNDPLTIATASVGFVALATLAGLIPAYRASQIDPTVALRDE